MVSAVADVTPATSKMYRTTIPRLTDANEANEIMSTLVGQAPRWHATDAAARVALLQEVRTRVIKSCLQAGAAVAQTQGILASDGTPDAGTSSFASLMVGTMEGGTINHLIEVMQSLATSTPPLRPPRARTASNGAAVFLVSPITKAQKSSRDAPKATELYVQPGKSSTQGTALAAAYSKPKDGVCVVLAAGNFISLGFVDVLHKLFVENVVVVLKHHDALAVEAPLLEYCLEPLKEAGCYQGVYCNIPITTALLQNPLTCGAHLTGSLKTHDAIVWGPPEEQAARRAGNDAVLKVPMTSELGNATPVVVTPAFWSQAELEKSAGNIVTNAKANSGCNCLAPKLIVIPAEWPQADAFEAALKAAIAAARPTTAWYPGTEAVFEAFCSSHDGVEKVMPSGDVAWTADKPVLPFAVASVTLSAPEEAAKIAGIQSEFFAPVLIVARLSMAAHLSSSHAATLASMSPMTATPSEGAGPGAAEKEAAGALTRAFLSHFPSFLNTYAWGNLVAGVHAHPDIEADFRDELTCAIDDMQYGSIVVNQFTFNAFGSHCGMWGGFQEPGTSVANPGSGVGHLQNGLQFDHPQKQVLWFDFDKMPADFPSAPPAWLSKGLVALLTNGFTGLLQAWYA